MLKILVILVSLMVVVGGTAMGVAAANNTGSPLTGLERGVQELRQWLAPGRVADLPEAITLQSEQKAQVAVKAQERNQVQVAVQAKQPEISTLNLEEISEAQRGATCDPLKGKTHPALSTLAGHFGVTYDEVVTWFCAGYGVGEIGLAYQISQSSGHPVAEVFALREQGMGWGEIFRYYDLQDEDITTPEDDDDEDDDGEKTRNPTYCGSVSPDSTQTDGTETKQHPAGLKLAAQFGVPYEEIMSWFCQGYGFGEVALAYSISLKMQVPVADVFALRESGMGWGQILKHYGITGGNPKKDFDKPEKEFKNKNNKGRPPKPVKP